MPELSCESGQSIPTVIISQHGLWHVIPPALDHVDAPRLLLLSSTRLFPRTALSVLDVQRSCKIRLDSIDESSFSPQKT